MGTGREGRMGRGFLTEPGAATVRKDCYAVFTELPRPRRDFISQSTGTGKGNRRLFPEKWSKDRVSREREKEIQGGGKRCGWRDFRSFVEARMGIELEGWNNPKRLKHKTTTKHKHSPLWFTRPTFSHRYFHNKNTGEASEMPLGNSGRYTEQVSGKGIQYIKHFGTLKFCLLHAELFPQSKPHRTNSYQREAKAWLHDWLRKTVKEGESLQRDPCEGTLLWISVGTEFPHSFPNAFYISLYTI